MPIDTQGRVSAQVPGSENGQISAVPTANGKRRRRRQPSQSGPMALAGLRVGRCGKGMGHVDDGTWAFIRARIKQAERLGLVVDDGFLLLLQSAARYERCALAAQREARLIEVQSVRARREALDRVAAASDARDRVLTRLGLLPADAPHSHAASQIVWPTAATPTADAGKANEGGTP